MSRIPRKFSIVSNPEAECYEILVKNDSGNWVNIDHFHILVMPDGTEVVPVEMISTIHRLLFDDYELVP